MVCILLYQEDVDDVCNDDIEGFIEDLDADRNGRVSWNEYLHSLQHQKYDTPITEQSAL